ncbi:MAG: hypothetical protein EOP34_10485, partial [Rickettsiales bacterium]
MAKSLDSGTETPYLKKVHLKDYRSIRDAEIIFQPGINIIIGPNGAGKTNFLGLTSELIVPYFLPANGEGCELIIASKQEFKISFGHRFIKKDKNAFDRHGLSARERIPITVEVDSKKATADYISDAFAEIQADIPYYWPVAIWHGIVINNTPVISINSDLKVSSSGAAEFEHYSSLDNPASSVLADELLSSLGRLFALKSYSISSISLKKAKKAVENIVAEFIKFLDNYLFLYSPVNSTRLSETFQLYINKDQGEIIIKGLVLEYQINNNWLPFSALSDGTKRIVYVISQLISPILTSNPNKKTGEFIPIKFNKIFFIEEPELGVHHSQLHKLLNLIREVSCEHQIILTTHAPQVLDMLRADELDRITICSLDPEKGTQFHKLTEEK